MRRLLPPPIEGWRAPIDSLSELAVEHRFDETGAVLVLDAEGSTELSARLRAEGTLDAESLSSLVTQIFGPVVDIAVEWGGFVAHFTGDGVIAVFRGDPSSSVAAAIGAAHDILDHLDALSGVITPAGPVELMVRAVIGAGSIETTIWWAPEVTNVRLQNACYVIVGSALAEAQRGELLVDGGALPVGPLPATYLNVGTFEASADGFVRVERGNRTAAESPPSTFAAGTLAPSIGPWRFVAPVAYDPHLAPQFLHASVMFLELRRWPTATTMAVIVEAAGESGGHVSNLLRSDSNQDGLTLILVWGAPTEHHDDADRALRFVETVQHQLGVAAFRTGVIYRTCSAGSSGPNGSRPTPSSARR